MKKLIGVLLISAMTISLAACGGQDSSEEPAAETQQTETQATAAPETDAPETDAQTLETDFCVLHTGCAFARKRQGDDSDS